MIVGCYSRCYSLVLYCDTPGCEMGDGGSARIGLPLCNEFNSEFGSECRREAREYGWKLDLSTGQAWCPWCTGKKDKQEK